MSDIFISYARADKERAELLANAFSRQGWSVWWDREIPPGKAFDEVIEDALHSARCVVVLWSGESVTSRWVKTEAAEGAGRGILVPALIENVQIPLEFRRIEAADLSDWQGDSRHPEFDQLLRTVAGLISDGAPRPRDQERALRNPQLRPWWKTKPGLLSASVLGIIGAFGLIFLFQRSTPFDGDQKQVPDRQTETASSPSDINPPVTAKSLHRVTEGQAGSAAKPASSKPSQDDVINLLAAENGGHVIAATNDRWRHAIDGDEKNWHYIDIGVQGGWAVYGFKDEKTATFDRFKVLILESESWNLKEFELLAGNDSPTGKFESLGKFQTQNIRFFKDPYQAFKFSPVKAKYLKVRVISSHGFSSVAVYEFQLLGSLET